MSDDRDLEELQSGCRQEGAHHSSNEDNELEQGQGLGPASGLTTGMGPLPSPATLPRRPSSENGHVHQQQVDLQDQEQQQEQVKKEDQAPLLLDAAVSVVQQLLEAGAAEQHGGTALRIAAQEGCKEAVRALLAAGAQPDAANEDGRTALWNAASEGNVDVVRALLAVGAQLEAATKDGRTALWNAASEGHVDVVRALLAAGAKLEAADKDGGTALQIAARGGHLEVVRALLAAGARLEAATKDGSTALRKAVMGGHLEVVRALLAAGAKLDAADKFGHKAMWAAATKGYLEVVRVLLQAGAQLAAADKEDGTALQIAAWGGRLSVVRALLEAGVKLDAAHKDDDMALLIAARRGHLEVVRALLAAGAQLEAADKDGRTALQVAASGGHLEVVGALLATGAQLEAADKDGATALHIAAYRGHLEVVRALLEAEAKLDAADDDGRTALQIAARGGLLEVVGALLAAGAHLEAADKGGRTALWLAASTDRLEVVRALLAAGAQLEAVTKDGCTVLMAAARRSRMEVVRALLDAGAQPDAADKEGRTALWFASKGGHMEIVRALLDEGAEPDAADKEGNTSMLIATLHGCTDMVKMLLRAGANINSANEVGLCPLGIATMLGFADIANALVASGARASGLPIKREEVRHLVKNMWDLFGTLGLQLPAIPAEVKLPQDGHLPAELVAFHCRAIMVMVNSEHGGNGGDYITSMVVHLARSMPAAWPAAYCSAQDALAMDSQTATLLQELAGRPQLTDIAYLLRNLKVVPSCPVLAIDQQQRVANNVKMVFSPNGRLLAAGTTAQEISLWDLQIGLYRTLGVNEGVRCLSFSNNSKLLAAGYSSKQVCVYDVASGKRVFSDNGLLSGLSHITEAVAFSCDGSRLACLTNDGRVHLYDAKSWVQTWELSCDFEGTIRSASLHAKGDAMYITITGEHSKEVRIYILPVQADEQGQQKGDGAFAKVLTHESPVKYVAVSAGCRLITTLEHSPCGIEQLQLWDMATGAKLGDPVEINGVVLCMAFSPNGNHMAIGRRNEAILLYECNEGGIIGPMPLASYYGPLPGGFSLVFSADGEQLAAAEFGVKSHICKLRVWDMALGNTSWLAAAGSSDPTAQSTRAGITHRNFLIRSCFNRPLFSRTDESLIAITYTPPDANGNSGSVGAFTSPWLKDEGQHLDVAARGYSTSSLLYDLVLSPATWSAESLRVLLSSFAPHTLAAASVALLHLGPSGALMALLGVAWAKYMEFCMLIYAEVWARLMECMIRYGESWATFAGEGRFKAGSLYEVSISEVALPHAAVALKGSVLEPLLADPWVPTSLWTKPAIKALLQLRWIRFTKKVVFYEFLIRAVYTGLFVAYALTLTGGSSWQDDNNNGRQDRCMADGASSGHHGMMYVLAIMTAEYVVMEARQMWGSGRRWLRHINMVDLVGLALMSTILGLHWSCKASLQTLRGLSAMLVLVLFWRLLYFATVNDELGNFVRMVMRVTANLRSFFIVLGVVYAGFALAVLVLGTDLQERSDASTNRSTASSYNSTVGSLARPVFMRLYTMIYGDFSKDWVLALDAPSSLLGNLAAVICSIYVFLVAIILLNLLIAMISDAYQGVMCAAELWTMREKARLIAETEQLLPAWFRSRRDDKLFRCQRVLVLQPAASGQSNGSGPDQSEPLQQQAWQGHVSHIQSLVEGMQTKMERRMDAVQGQLGAQLQAQQGQLETQLQAQQCRLGAQLQAQQERLEAMQTLLLRMVPPNGGLDMQATGWEADKAGKV